MFVVIISFFVFCLFLVIIFIIIADIIIVVSTSRWGLDNRQTKSIASVISQIWIEPQHLCPYQANDTCMKHVKKDSIIKYCASIFTNVDFASYFKVLILCFPNLPTFLNLPKYHGYHTMVPCFSRPRLVHIGIHTLNI